MKTFILFREGSSGHYLKSVLKEEKTLAKFRMDPWYPGLYQELRPSTSNENITCGHNLVSNTYDLILTILVEEKIYQAIYNVFYKKMLIENFTELEYQNWKKNLTFWYDKSFYNIKEYYFLFKQDFNNNKNPNIVSFDKLLDVDYIESISLKYLNKPLALHSRDLIADYASKQLDINLTVNGQSMEEIVEPIPDKYFQDGPWFASYAIFKFELNNQLDESQRLWSIDKITKPINREFLLNLQHQYN